MPALSPKGKFEVEVNGDVFECRDLSQREAFEIADMVHHGEDGRIEGSMRAAYKTALLVLTGFKVFKDGEDADAPDVPWDAKDPHKNLDRLPSLCINRIAGAANDRCHLSPGEAKN